MDGPSALFDLLRQVKVAFTDTVPKQVFKGKHVDGESIAAAVTLALDSVIGVAVSLPADPLARNVAHDIVTSAMRTCALLRAHDMDAWAGGRGMPLCERLALALGAIFRATTMQTKPKTKLMTDVLALIPGDGSTPVHRAPDWLPPQESAGELMTLVENMMPDDREEDRRNRFLNEVQAIVDNVRATRSAAIVVFGSFISRLYTRHSDLDVYLDFPKDHPLSVALRAEEEKARLAAAAENGDGDDGGDDDGGDGDGGDGDGDGEGSTDGAEERAPARVGRNGRTYRRRGDDRPRILKDSVYELARALRSRGMVDVSPIVHARVPICTFRDPRTRLRVDISFANHLGVEKSESLRSLTVVDDRFRQLAFAVKAWAKSRGVNDAGGGSFNSFAYCMMIITFLQARSPPILPRFTDVLAAAEETQSSVADVLVDAFAGFGRANTETTASLVVDWFYFYGFDFDPDKTFISPRLGAYPPIDQGRDDGLRIRRDGGWGIQDPWLPNVNCGGSLAPTKGRSIILAMRETYLRMVNPLAAPWGSSIITNRVPVELLE